MQVADWGEGTKGVGDILAAIKHSVAEGRVLLVHFRNITSSLPASGETFVDNQYMDMYQIMKTFVETRYSNTMILDHTPRFVEGYEEARTTYAIGYMRALVERVEAELNIEKTIRPEKRQSH